MWARLAAAERRLGAVEGVQLWAWSSAAPGELELNGIPQRSARGSESASDAWEALVHHEDLRSFRAGIAGVLETPGSFEVEARLRLDGESFRWQLVRGASTYGPDGAPALEAIGTFVDIEQRKRHERELERVNEQLTLVAQGTSSGIWDWPDMSLDYIEILPELRDFLGYTRDEVADSMESIFGIIHPDDHARVSSDIERVKDTGGRYGSSFRVRFRDGRYRWIRSAGSIVRDAGGPGVHRLTGALTDIHERVVAQQRLAAANEQLRGFANLVAHDLAAPLRHVKAYADILHEEFGSSLGEVGLGYLRVISRAVVQSSGMIDDLLAYARTGTSELRAEPIDLGALCEELRGRLCAGTDAAHASFGIGALPTIVADRTQMMMLFQNLLANAIKFTSENSAARIDVLEGPGDVEDYEIVVRDNGVGFDPQYNSYIFEAFARAESATRFPGTGIGLANVERIVRRHGGRIQALGEVGVGAEFHVFLPRVPA